MSMVSEGGMSCVSPSEGGVASVSVIPSKRGLGCICAIKIIVLVQFLRNVLYQCFLYFLNKTYLVGATGSIFMELFCTCILCSLYGLMSSFVSA